MHRASQLAALLFCALWLGCGFLAYGATGHDDAHINFWSAWTLLEHGAILNYNGDRVEQTTSLLLDFLAIILHWILRADLVTSGFLVDIIASAFCFGLMHRIAQKLSPHLSWWPSVLLSSSASFTLWAFGGMGASLAAAILLWGTWVLWQWLEAEQPSKTLWLKLLFSTALLTTVRPEMPLIIIALSGLAAIFYRIETKQWRRGLLACCISIMACALLLLWQQWYFDSWLPLPALAKQSNGFLTHWRFGSFYLLLNGILNPIFLLSLAAIPFLYWKRNFFSPQSRLLVIICLSAALYTGFVWAVGGDWMQAGRFIVPIIPLASLLIVAALSPLRWRWFTHSVLAALCIGQLTWQYTAIAKLSHGIPAWASYRITPEHQKKYSVFEQLNQEHIRDMAVIDHLQEIIPVLYQKLHRPVQLMSGQAGMVFYYTAQQFGNKVAFRDLRGLVEGSLSQCSILQSLPRASQGLFWGYKDFFTQLPNLEKACGITAPDVIYDINDMTQKLGKTLEPFGYTLIHRETGFFVENKTSLPYNRLLSPNMIFIRNDLLPLLNNQSPRIINYSDLPLQSRWPFNNAP